MASILNRALGQITKHYVAPGEVVPEITFLLRRIFLLYNFRTWTEFAQSIETHPQQMYKWKNGKGKPAQKYLLKMMDMILAVHTKKVIELQAQIESLQEHEIPCSYCPVGNLLKNDSTT